ncbi:MAG: hypothetical protein H6861_02005 [Rhodospirillales bacterium]|nr:hypothetical protein [Rhodospirillales bacterium]
MNLREFFEKPRNQVITTTASIAISLSLAAGSVSNFMSRGYEAKTADEREPVFLSEHTKVIYDAEAKQASKTCISDAFNPTHGDCVLRIPLSEKPERLPDEQMAAGNLFGVYGGVQIYASNE